MRGARCIPISLMIDVIVEEDWDAEIRCAAVLGELLALVRTYVYDISALTLGFFPCYCSHPLSALFVTSVLRRTRASLVVSLVVVLDDSHTRSLPCLSVVL